METCSIRRNKLTKVTSLALSYNDKPEHNNWPPITGPTARHQKSVSLVNPIEPKHSALGPGAPSTVVMVIVIVWVMNGQGVSGGHWRVVLMTPLSSPKDFIYSIEINHEIEEFSRH